MAHHGYYMPSGGILKHKFKSRFTFVRSDLFLGSAWFRSYRPLNYTPFYDPTKIKTWGWGRRANDKLWAREGRVRIRVRASTVRDVGMLASQNIF
jgi:hypothetical protein